MSTLDPSGTVTPTAALGDRVTQRISQVLRRPASALTPRTELAALAVDSFALVELVLELQDDFQVRFDHTDVQRLTTVGDVLELVADRVRAPR